LDIITGEDNGAAHLSADVVFSGARKDHRLAYRKCRASQITSAEKSRRQVCRMVAHGRHHYGYSSNPRVTGLAGDACPFRLV
jgi:hypothetical protein